MILALHYRTEEYGCVVYEIRGMLGEIKYQEVEVQSYHTLSTVIKNKLRIETDRPDPKGKPTEYLVYHFQRNTIPRPHGLPHLDRSTETDRQRTYTRTTMDCKAKEMTGFLS
jgi:hypothetical protein